MSNKSFQEAKDELENIFGRVPSPLNSIADEDMVNETPIFKKYTIEETEIPPKYRELIGLAVAANIKCPYCSHFHTKAAKLHGATEEELKETYTLASFTSRYSSMLHAQQYDLEKFKKECSKIEQHLKK